MQDPRYIFLEKEISQTGVKPGQRRALPALGFPNFSVGLEDHFGFGMSDHLVVPRVYRVPAAGTYQQLR